MRRPLRGALLLTVPLLLGLSACTPQADPASAPATSSGSPTPTPTAAGPVEFDQELHDELIAMAERDQDERTGGPQGEGDRARTQRLGEILDEHGWPTFDLVGEDGEDAAWVIAQHSDLDPAFQERALELLREAVERGQASPGNLAYLEDRVAVAKGEPQTYGTQIGCGPEGAEPATPIRDEAGVEERRAAADLPPLEEYLAELDDICAEEEPLSGG